MTSLLFDTDKVGKVVSDLVLLLVASVIFFFWFRSKLRQKNSISPIPGLEMVPGGHWLFGHIKHLTGPLKVGDTDYFDHLFVDYANEQGISCAYYFGEYQTYATDSFLLVTITQQSKHNCWSYAFLL